MFLQNAARTYGTILFLLLLSGAKLFTEGRVTQLPQEGKAELLREDGAPRTTSRPSFFALARCPISPPLPWPRSPGPVPFPSVPFRSLPFPFIPFRSLTFRSVPFPSVPFRSAPFRSVPFRSVPIRFVGEPGHKGRRGRGGLVPLCLSWGAGAGPPAMAGGGGRGREYVRLSPLAARPPLPPARARDALRGEPGAPPPPLPPLPRSLPSPAPPSSPARPPARGGAGVLIPAHLFFSCSPSSPPSGPPPAAPARAAC